MKLLAPSKLALPARNSKMSASWFFNKDKEKTAGHSTLISKDQAVYEIVTDRVIPGQWDNYVNHKGDLISCMKDQAEIKCSHVASWNVVTGDAAFTAIHLFEYDGWKEIDATRTFLKSNKQNQDLLRVTELAKSGLPYITNQHIELTKAFSFWPSPDVRVGDNVYDIRSYSLIPGSLYDWSNYWAKGIKHRSAVRDDVPYAGLFTQLGKLHTIYHIWCYKSLADRKQCREGTWAYPEWNDVVANTVPLVNSMSTTIVEPLPFSPTQ